MTQPRYWQSDLLPSKNFCMCPGYMARKMAWVSTRSKAILDRPIT